jgi:hypothetical protein
MRKYYSIKSVKALQSCFFRPLEKEREKEREREREMESKGRGGRNTHKKNSSPQIFVRKKSKKKRSKTQESDVFSRQGPKKRPKKQSLGSNESEEARERRNAGHHTSHAQHTISSWHSDKP